MGLKIKQHLFFSLTVKSFFQSKVSHFSCFCIALQRQEHWGKWQRLQTKPLPGSVTPMLWVPRNFMSSGPASSPSWLCAFLHSVSGLRPPAGAGCRQAPDTCDKAGARHQPAWQTAGTSNTAGVASVQRD